MSTRSCAAILLSGALTFCLACETDLTPDAGPSDTGRPDTGLLDTGVLRDSGARDTGNRADAGFADPNTIFEGTSIIEGARVYVHVRGTVTSTMPPLFVLTTGPQQGGFPGLFGQLGGGIGHEYMPAHGDFLLEGRLMIYYDYTAVGRSGFGTTGSATVSVDGHVLQMTEVIDWVGTDVGGNVTQIDILGHGYGSGVGMLWAAQNPTRVSRLVLVNPMGANVTQYADSIGTLQSRLTSSDRDKLNVISREPECFGDLSLCTVEIWRVLAPRLGCPENEAVINDELRFMFGELRAFDFLRQYLQEAQYDWSVELSQVEADTVVISGPCDASPPEVPLSYTSSIAGAVHVEIPNSGHWPMVENTGEYQRVVRQALTY